VTLAVLISAVGLTGLLFNPLAAFGLALTIVGAVSHVGWLLTVGPVLLIAELIDLSIVWPAGRARIGLASADVTQRGTSQP
jgi:hypothetical protein